MRISVSVKPGTKLSKVQRIGPDNYAVWVRARPHEGKANAAVIELLSDFFGVPKTSLEIVRGANSRTKLIELHVTPRGDRQ